MWMCCLAIVKLLLNQQMHQRPRMTPVKGQNPTAYPLLGCLPDSPLLLLFLIRLPQPG